MKYGHDGYGADGYRLDPPAKDHPNPRHWKQIRRIALLRDGHACRTCWKTARDGYLLECFHRHYESWGRECAEDVVILCVRCRDLHRNEMSQARQAFRDTMLLPANAPVDIYMPYGRKKVTSDRPE